MPKQNQLLPVCELVNIAAQKTVSTNTKTACLIFHTSIYGMLENTRQTLYLMKISLLTSFITKKYLGLLVFNQFRALNQKLPVIPCVEYVSIKNMCVCVCIVYLLFRYF